MTTMLHNIAAGAAGFARSTDEYMQEVRFVGHIWSGARDYAVLPLSNLVSKYVGPFFNNIGDFATTRNLAIGGVVIVLGLAGLRHYFRVPTAEDITALRAAVDKAQKAVTDQAALIKQLTTTSQAAGAATEQAEQLAETVGDRADQITTAKAAQEKANAALTTATDAMPKLEADLKKANDAHGAAVKAKQDADAAARKKD